MSTLRYAQFKQREAAREKIARKWIAEAPFRRGDTVYVVSNEETRSKTPITSLPLRMMGIPLKVIGLSPYWIDQYEIAFLRYTVEAIKPSPMFGVFMVCEGDLSYENTFVPPFTYEKDLPATLSTYDIPNDLGYTEHTAYYNVFIHKDRRKKLPTYTDHNRGRVPYSLPGEDCSCWGDMSDAVTEVWGNYERCPTHIAVLLSYEDRFRARNKIQDAANGKIEYYGGDDDILEYYRYMQEVDIIPGDVNLSLLKPGEGWAATFCLDDTSVERMYAIMCSLRLPVEWPAIVAHTVNYCRKGIHPILAYCLGHCMAVGFDGGHSMLRGSAFRDDRSDHTLPLPDPLKVAHQSARVAKFLLGNTLPTMQEEARGDHCRHWRMYEHIHTEPEDATEYGISLNGFHFEGDKDAIMKLGITLDNLHLFNPETLTLEEDTNGKK